MDIEDAKYMVRTILSKGNAAAVVEAIESLERQLAEATAMHEKMAWCYGESEKEIAKIAETAGGKRGSALQAVDALAAEVEALRGKVIPVRDMSLLLKCAQFVGTFAYNLRDSRPVESLAREAKVYTDEIFKANLSPPASTDKPGQARAKCDNANGCICAEHCSALSGCKFQAIIGHTHTDKQAKCHCDMSGYPVCSAFVAPPKGYSRDGCDGRLPNGNSCGHRDVCHNPADQQAGGQEKIS